MKKLIQILKKMGLFIGISILVLLVGIMLFLYLSPTFGGSSTDSQLKMYAKSSQYKDGKFTNTLPVSLDMAAGDMLSILYKYVSPPPMTIPEQSIPVEKMERGEILDYQGPTRLFWFGHSAFLVQVDGMNVLIDPMLGDVPAPHPWLGSGRFNDTLPMNIDQLPDIDAVLISHDHYDHLDYPSIVALRDKVNRFFVPLGVAAHLVKWGIKPSNIRELDWWDEAKLSSLSFTCAPAQHFSGRAFSDRSSTLWSSWIIQSDSVQIYFSGDSGYSPHFKEIGDRHGPFDLALLECGQYNTLWPQVHMFPEETVQAGLDLQAKLITPIHWGAFKLSTHAWNEPALRVTQKASEVQLPILIPKIGEPFSPKDTLLSNGIWWSLP